MDSILDARHVNFALCVKELLALSYLLSELRIKLWYVDLDAIQIRFDSIRFDCKGSVSSHTYRAERSGDEAVPERGRK